MACPRMRRSRWSAGSTHSHSSHRRLGVRVAQWWKRIFLGNAQDVEMDGTGRVLVSPELREAAGISRETMLLGMGNHFELWDRATYEAKEAEAMAAGTPDAFKDFTF